MEVKYNIRYLMEDNEFDFIELKLSSNSLNKKEIQVLKENGIEHKYLENNEIILIIKLMNISNKTSFFLLINILMIIKLE